MKIVCNACDRSLRILGNESALFLQDPTHRCPWCESADLVYDEKEALQTSGYCVDLDLLACSNALYGLGFPTEREFTAKQLEDLLCSVPIVKVELRKIPGSKPCLDSFTLQDGSRVYLGSSAHGAVVYRIRSYGHSYVDELKKE